MVIYVDVLVFLNTLVTYFLLVSECCIFKSRPKIYRLILGSLCGGFSALVIFLPSLPSAADFCLKAIICTTIIFITFGFFNKIRFLKLCLSFLAITYIYGGAMLAVYSLFCPPDMAVGNGVTYFNISPFVLITSTVVCYLFIRLIWFLKSKSKSEQVIYECRLKHNGKSSSFLAINDTGNSLCDPYFNNPVAVVYKKAISEVINEKTRLYMIPISCVSSEGCVYAFRPDEFFIIKNGKNIAIKNITIAICENKVHSQFEGLLSPQITESMEDELCELSKS